MRKGTNATVGKNKRGFSWERRAPGLLGEHAAEGVAVPQCGHRLREGRRRARRLDPPNPSPTGTAAGFNQFGGGKILKLLKK